MFRSHRPERHRKEERDKRNDGKTRRSAPVEAQGSTTEEETPKKHTRGSVGKSRSDKQGGTTSARGSERKTEATASAQKSKEKAPAQAHGGENGTSKKTAEAVMIGPDNWELRRIKARDELRRVGIAGGVNTPGTGVPNGSGTQGTSDKAQKGPGDNTNKPVVPKTEKMRIYTEQLKKELNENFKLQDRISNGSIAVLSSDTLQETRRQMYGPGKTKFTDEEWNEKKLRLYTTDEGNVLVLVPKDPEQQPRIQPVLPPKFGGEEYNKWKCSATFNMDVFHAVEISREKFLKDIFHKPFDEAEVTLLKNK